MHALRCCLSAAGLLCACSVGTNGDASGDVGSDSTTGSNDGNDTSTAGSDDGADDGDQGGSGDDSGSDGDNLPKYDVDPGDSGGGAGGDPCKVADDGNALPPCTEKAPPESFEPEVQWAWEGADGFGQVVATPLVGNLTDDNDDGKIDLCDVPDVVVVAYEADYDNFGAKWNAPARLFVLDGATGALHFTSEIPVLPAVNPALGDIDHDGVPEIIVGKAHPDSNVNEGSLMALDPDGTLLWETDLYATADGSIALADLDADGSVEIMQRGRVFDEAGALVWEGAITGYQQDGTEAKSAPVAMDLDGDGKLEVLWGSIVHHHDGSTFFAQPELGTGTPGDLYNWPHVADLDDDGLPEVLLARWYGGARVLEHDGTLSATITEFGTPAAIHDIDGDDVPNVLGGESTSFAVFTPKLQTIWSQPIRDGSGSAGATAFDFLGDGTAEAIYADESQLRVHDESGNVLMEVPRDSWTSHETPIVADVDNDGSAEIVVVSNAGWSGGQTSPAVQVIRDAEDRWVGARRIWNQHTYHVTNVREDGTIPQHQPHSWELLNTFRTQAQLEGGAICDPEG